MARLIVAPLIARGQVARVGVDGFYGVEEIEARDGIGEHQVRIEEGANGADVFPVALEDVGHDGALVDEPRDDVLAEVNFRVIGESVDEGLAVEDVDAHRGLIQIGVGGLAELAEQRGRDPQLVEHGGVLGFLDEFDDFPLGIGVHDAEARRVGARDGEGGERHLGLGLDVLREKFAVVHAVELIAAEDHVVFVRMLEEIAEVLAHGVGGALIPARIRRCLLSGEDFDERVREGVELVAQVDVAVQRHGVELREDVDVPQAGVDAVRDRNIDDTIFSAERDGGFSAFLGEGEESRTRAATHDDSERFFGDGGRGHGVMLAGITDGFNLRLDARNHLDRTTNVACPQTEPPSLRVCARVDPLAAHRRRAL